MPVVSKKAKTGTNRKLLYKTPCAEFCLGKLAITEQKSKELLGWQEEEEGKSFGNNYSPELYRLFGRKIRVNNNITNRPLYSARVSILEQEQMRKKWNFNGEPIIVGRTGLILNGQHCLISLIHLSEMWREDNDQYPLILKAPTLDKLVVYGVAEDDATVNTMDTCKPRSLADVIYRCHYFKKMPKGDHSALAKQTGSAVRMLWARSGVHDAFAPGKLTHSEAIAYLDRHPTLLQSVAHIYEENGSKQISKYLPQGYAAAALYLMASSTTEPETYYKSEDQHEGLLDLELWEQACEFFVLLAAGDVRLKPVGRACAKLLEDGHQSLAATFVILANAWEWFCGSKERELVMDDVLPAFDVKDGEFHMLSSSLFGGIDVGEGGTEFTVNGDPTPEEIAEATERLRSKRDKLQKEANRIGDNWAKGDFAWVHPVNNGIAEDPYFAELSDDPYPIANGGHRVIVDAEDGTWEEDIARLSLYQFELKC